MVQSIFMIIDDDKDDKFFFKQTTEGMFNACCLQANDGADALRQLRKKNQLPDFIFLDVNMPRMDGKECLKELKKDKKLKYIPVIMYSTSFSEQSIEEFRMLGSANYLLKPTDMSKLPEQIIMAMKKSILPTL
ncbi:MAG: response regulator [Flavobacterium sp.]|uniref:response regulator n=1 Tax=Flavobacterium sp. TaxID=239 RepID=UPI003264656E